MVSKMADDIIMLHVHKSSLRCVNALVIFLDIFVLLKSNMAAKMTVIIQKNNYALRVTEGKKNNILR